MMNDRLAPMCTCTLLAVTAVALLAVNSEAASRPGGTLNGAWRPCRAANRRRYEEVPSPMKDAEGDGFGEGPGHQDFDDEADDDDEVGEDKNEYFSSFHEDEKPKRGVRVASSPHNVIVAANSINDDDEFDDNNNMHNDHSKKFNPFPVDSPGNGLRMDATSLFRSGETVELPTYVNVPVTLRCKFVPLNGVENKFETIIESMYPGHANSVSPSLQQQVQPPSDSHASRLLGQLIGSTNGWRGVINKAVQPARRAIDNRLARPVRLAHFEDWEAPLPLNGRYVKDNGRGTVERRKGGGIIGGRRYGGDVIGWQIAARQRAAERMHRFQDVRKDHRQLEEKQPLVKQAEKPEAERDQPEAEPEQLEVNQEHSGERSFTKNLLLESQLAEQDHHPVESIDGQQINVNQSEEQENDSQLFKQIESGQSIEREEQGQTVEQVENGQPFGQQENGQSIERIESGQQFGQLEYGQSIKQTENGQRFGQLENDQSIHQLTSGQSLERVESGLSLDKIEESHPFEQLENGLSPVKRIIKDDQQFDQFGSSGKFDKVDEQVHDRGMDQEDDRVADHSDDSEKQEEQTVNWTTATTIKSDFSTFFKGIPVKTYVEYINTTPSTE